MGHLRSNHTTQQFTINTVDRSSELIVPILVLLINDTVVVQVAGTHDKLAKVILSLIPGLIDQDVVDGVIQVAVPCDVQQIGACLVHISGSSVAELDLELAVLTNLQRLVGTAHRPGQEGQPVLAIGGQDLLPPLGVGAVGVGHSEVLLGDLVHGLELPLFVLLIDRVVSAVVRAIRTVTVRCEHTALDPGLELFVRTVIPIDNQIVDTHIVVVPIHHSELEDLGAVLGGIKAEPGPEDGAVVLTALPVIRLGVVVGVLVIPAVGDLVVGIVLRHTILGDGHVVVAVAAVGRGAGSDGVEVDIGLQDLHLHTVVGHPVRQVGIVDDVIGPHIGSRIHVHHVGSRLTSREAIDIPALELLVRLAAVYLVDRHLPHLLVVLGDVVFGSACDRIADPHVVQSQGIDSVDPDHISGRGALVVGITPVDTIGVHRVVRVTPSLAILMNSNEDVADRLALLQRHDHRTGHLHVVRRPNLTVVHHSDVAHVAQSLAQIQGDVLRGHG